MSTDGHVLLFSTSVLKYPSYFFRDQPDITVRCSRCYPFPSVRPLYSLYMMFNDGPSATFTAKIFTFHPTEADESPPAFPRIALGPDTR